MTTAASEYWRHAEKRQSFVWIYRCSESGMWDRMAQYGDRKVKMMIRRRKTGKTKKRIFILPWITACVLAWTLLFSWFTYAAETDGTDTLTVHCEYLEHAVPDVTVSLYYAAEIDDMGNFIPDGDFAAYTTADDLMDLDLAEKNAAVSARLVQAAEQNNILSDGSARTDETGTAYFSGLKEGLYLLAPTGTGVYHILPALIRIPQLTENGNAEPAEVFMKISKASEPTVTPTPTVTPKPAASPAPTAAVTPARTGKVKTGDSSHIGFYLALIFVSGATVCILVGRHNSGKNK